MNIYAVLIDNKWTLGTYKECFDLAKQTNLGSKVFKLTEVATYPVKKFPAKEKSK